MPLFWVGLARSDFHVEYWLIIVCDIFIVKLKQKNYGFKINQIERH